MKTVHGQKENNKGNNIEQSVSFEDTKNNELENNLDNVFIKPYREFKRNKDIYELLINCDQVFDKIPNVIKSNKQFVVDMNNYYFPNSKRPFKFYDDCGEWDYKTKNYKTLYYLKSNFSQVYKKDGFFSKSLNPAL